MIPIEDPRTHASRFLETCGEALQLQYERVRELAKTPRDPRDTMEWHVLEPDCYLLVLAIRQAVVSVKAVAQFEDGLVKDRIDRALGTMADAKHEDLRNLRNVLTHFDAYLSGDGNLQKKRNREKLPNPNFYVHRKWRRNRSGELLLWVRVFHNAGEPGISAEVLSASRWVMALINETREAIAPRSGSARGM